MTVLAASVQLRDGAWFAESGTMYRTQRRLFEGSVYVPASKVPGLVQLQHSQACAAE